MDKSKKGTDRESKVLFINAHDIFTVVDRAHNTWTDEQIEEIASIVRSYRGEEGNKKYKDIKGRCQVVALDKIKKSDYSLNPGRYVEIVDELVDTIDFEEQIKKLSGEFKSLTEESREIEKTLINDWKKIF